MESVHVAVDSAVTTINYDPSKMGMFVLGDNLRIMSDLGQNPSVCGKVNLVYLDPPYATGRKFYDTKDDNLVFAYDDTKVGDDYLKELEPRLVALHSLLADTGTLVVHLDMKMVCEVKLLLDRIFYPAPLLTFITREKCQIKNQTSRKFPDVSDYLLVYAKGENSKFNRISVDRNDTAVESLYPNVDPITGERFTTRPIYAPGSRKGETSLSWKGMMPPPQKHWIKTPSGLDQLDAEGLIHWSGTGNPRVKIWERDNKGSTIANIWEDVRDSNRDAKATTYPTEKNIRALERVIEAYTDPNDLVLDAYAGSGTTLVAAEQLNRRWIGIDIGNLSAKTIKYRFEAIGRSYTLIDNTCS